jgi:hypothetical protein
MVQDANNLGKLYSFAIVMIAKTAAITAVSAMS